MLLINPRTRGRKMDMPSRINHGKKFSKNTGCTENCSLKMQHETGKTFTVSNYLLFITYKTLKSLLIVTKLSTFCVYSVVFSHSLDSNKCLHV
jgi:hypothetical protein